MTMRVLVKGAGVAGLAVAHELASRGVPVDVHETRPEPGRGASWYAGGMLAPFCERESAEEAVLTLGRQAADWWDEALPGSVTRNGTLVVAPPRDTGELVRFAGRTQGYEWLDGEGIAELEPDLRGRFSKALFFGDEAHLDPRHVLALLAQKLASMDVGLRFGMPEADIHADEGYDRIVDCTGAARIGSLDGLRGVRGEMLYLATYDIALSRPVRLLHPRHPLYVVPREAGRFMVGATMIESSAEGPISARSLMELLNAAYALHPAFSEATVLETGTGIRPAFADNLPGLVYDGTTIHLNGSYRHGFLLSPAMARRAADAVL